MNKIHPPMWLIALSIAALCVSAAMSVPSTSQPTRHGALGNLDALEGATMAAIQLTLGALVGDPYQ